jgi:hypothetical protein
MPCELPDRFDQHARWQSRPERIGPSCHETKLTPRKYPGPTATALQGVPYDWWRERLYGSRKTRVHFAIDPTTVLACGQVYAPHRTTTAGRSLNVYFENEPGRRSAALVARLRALSLTALICCGVNQ